MAAAGGPQGTPQEGGGRAICCYDCVVVLDRLRSGLSRPALALLVALALATAAYWRVLGGEFLFDDLDNIQRNLALKDLGGYVADHLFADFAGGQRPVTYLTFALNYALAGVEPWSYHLTNLLIHLVTVVLVWRLTRAVLHLAGAARSEWVSVAVAGLFALHPIQSEAVSYVVQRYESLASALYVATLLLLLAAERRGLTRRSAFVWAAAFASFALALGAKQIAVTLPAAWLLLAAALPAPERRGELLSSSARAIAVLPFAALGAFSMARALGTISRLGYAGFSIPRLPPWTYFMTELRAIVVYLRLLAWPAGQNVDWGFPISVALDGTVVLAGGFLVALAAGAVALLALARRWNGEDAAAARVAGFGVLWFFLVLSVTSSFLPLTEVFAEHRLYLASWGVFLAAAVGLGRALARAKLSRPVPAIAAILVVAWGAPAAALYRRNAVWESGRALWTDAVEKAPRYFRPRNNLAYALKKAGDKEGAVLEWRLAAALWPESMVGDALRDVRRIEALAASGHRAEAASLIEEVRLRTMPTPRVLIPLAMAQVNVGLPRDAELTVSWVLLLSGSSPEALTVLGRAYMAQGRFDEAAAAAAEALEMSGDSTPTRALLAQALSAAGRAAEACAALSSTSPSSPEIQVTARALGCKR